MSKVFIVQEPMRRNRNTGEMERMMDLTPAAAYGDLDVLIKSHQLPLMAAPFIQTLQSGLRNFGDDDYIVPVGSPAAIAFAGAVAAEMNRGQLNLLVWDKQTSQYIKVSGNVRQR
jgi:hypothetical protein